MPTHLERFKGAERELTTLTDAFPNLETALDHRLRVFFPTLPEDICTDFLFRNYLLTPEPGQSSVIASQSLSQLIDECYLTQTVPTFGPESGRIYHQDYTLADQDKVREITLPALEKYLDFTTHNLETCVRSALTDFWRKKSERFGGQTPKIWLSQFIQKLMLAEANVRRADQTLSVAALEAINQLFPAPAAVAPLTTTFGFYTLALNGHSSVPTVALYGAFIITTKDLPVDPFNPHYKRIIQDDTPRTVVLYTPRNGLETFDSITALTVELNARIKDDYQRETLLHCVLNEERVRALAHQNVDVLAVNQEDTTTFYVDQLIAKQDRDIRHDWMLARNQQQDTSIELLSERIEFLLTSSWLIKPEFLLQARYTRLIESQLPLWLKNASVTDKTQWRLAFERLNRERSSSQASNAHPLNEIGEKSTLLGYARVQLKQQIKIDHGIDVDPDSIFISTTEAVQTGPVFNPGQSSFPQGYSLPRTGPTLTYKTTRRSLSEVALSNVGIWDVTFALTAQVKDAGGKTHPVLTRSYLKGLVRQLDIGQRYKNLLNSLLVNSAQAQWRKERYVEFKKAQLTLDLLEAKLSGNLNTVEAAMIQFAYDHPLDSTRPRLNAELIKVHLLMLRYKPLPGILVFSTTGSNRLICYMPGSPDNTWFLTANSRSELSQKLSRADLRAYILRRVTPAQQAYIKPLIEKGLTDDTVRLQPINHDFFKASYDTEALHAINDADEQSTSTWESNLNTAKETALTVIDIISIVLPTKVLLPVALARFSYQVILGKDALRRDQQHEALLYFLDSITHLTDGASDFAGSAVFGASIRQRVKQPAPVLSKSAASTLSLQALTLRRGEAYAGGVYEQTVTSGRSTPEHYLKTSDNALYASRYDNLDDAWRTIDGRQPDALYNLPMRELSSGIWDVDPNLPQKTGIQRVIESAQVSGINLDRYTPDAQGIYRVGNNRYIQEQGVVFEVFSGWLGRDWYLQLPSSSSTGGGARYKLRRSAGYWEIKHKPTASTKFWEPLVRNSSQLPEAVPTINYSDYDVPSEYRTKIKNWIHEHRSFVDTTGASASIDYTNHQLIFSQLRFRLLDDARAFLSTKPAKPRVNRPQLPAEISLENASKRMFEHSTGLVFGETHSHQSPKKVLITQMEAYAKSDVATLYLEHLQTDLHQPLLDEFHTTGKMPIVLDEFLKAQDLGHRIDPSSPYNYSQLVRKAQRHGIEIKALDCMASYNHRGMRMRPDGSEPLSQDLIRYQSFSYFASRIIRTNQLRNGGRKWIALVGNSHSNTYKGIPGLAELEGVISVRVSDTAPNTGRGLRQDIVDVIKPSHYSHNVEVLKHDYWLEVDIPQAHAPEQPLSLVQLNERLKHPGYFRFEANLPEGAQLIHRASNHEIIRTPIHTDPDGQFYIERESWGSTIHQKRYDTMEDLIKDLRDRGMSQMQ